MRSHKHTSIEIVDWASKLIGKHVHLTWQEASGNTGGGFSAGWQDVTLNTERINTIPGASLTSGYLVLPAGVYHVEAHKHLSRCSTGGGYWGTAVRDGSNNVLIDLVGIESLLGDRCVSTSCRGIVVLTEQKVLKISCYQGSTSCTGSDCFGQDLGFTGIDNVWAELLVWQTR